METSANDFYDSLNTIGLVQYHDEFVREAFDTWEVLIDITESDLDALGVKLGHRRILQRAISDYRRKNSYDESSYDMVEEQNGLRKADPVLAVDEDANGNGVARVSVNGKRRYKRHPKADEYAPDRPPSAYVLFSNQTRADLKGSDPSFTEIAKTVGERWRVLAQDEKATYESRSQAAKDKYYSQLSEYKKTSKFAEYQIYLADFKAKHEPPPPGGKRKRDDKLSSLTSRCSNGTDAGASSPENSYLHAESSLHPRSSFVEFPSSSNTPDFKHPKYTPSQSTTRQCNAAAADSSSISPRLPKPRFAPKPTAERQKPATLPLLPPYKETVCVSEYAFTTHINHPMAIITISKILRQKEKYLTLDDASKARHKRGQGRSPDVVRALTVWVRNRKDSMGVLEKTLSAIRQRAQASKSILQALKTGHNEGSRAAPARSTRNDAQIGGRLDWDPSSLKMLVKKNGTHKKYAEVAVPVSDPQVPTETVEGGKKVKLSDKEIAAAKERELANRRDKMFKDLDDAL
ncbi:hypothetical protein B0A48_18624 [Cryoendolithus antarcticus]|uniref:HMG box domain-containing protein n=1 Tax=Cryoendolithus antarcticus TaxID=1507870 RepID=A0A1V8S8P6_9PEZI|nr:hypothetical protein B0A48_18624 [Cryoendolithus antarcticus]